MQIQGYTPEAGTVAGQADSSSHLIPWQSGNLQLCCPELFQRFPVPSGAKWVFPGRHSARMR
jgi:hypothetical protein